MLKNHALQERSSALEDLATAELIRADSSRGLDGQDQQQ
jgi:hypothetical protein